MKTGALSWRHYQTTCSRCVLGFVSVNEKMNLRQCVIVSGTLSLIPEGVTKCNYFPMMTVFRNNMMGSKVPSSLQSAVCWEWLLMPVEKVERIPFFSRKISSFSGQILNNNCPVLLCHLNRYPEIFTLWSDLIFLFMHVFCSHLLCVNRRRKNNLSALSLPMFL